MRDNFDSLSLAGSEAIFQNFSELGALPRCLSFGTDSKQSHIKMLPTISQEGRIEKLLAVHRMISQKTISYRQVVLAFAVGLVLLMAAVIKLCNPVTGEVNALASKSSSRPLLALPAVESYDGLNSRLAGFVHGIPWKTNLSFPQDSSTRTIPNVLYVSVADRAKPPAGVKQSVSTCANLNPLYKVEIVGEDERTSIIQQHAPLLLPLYNKFKPTEKNDFWSHFMLYLFGGWYIDHDVQCFKPFEEFHAAFDHTAKAVVGVEAALPEGGWGAVGFCCPVQYCHWLMGSIPGHPLFGLVVDLMLDRQAVAEADQNSAAAHHIGNPIMTTGPGILSKAVEQYMALFDAYPVDVALETPEMVGDLGVMPRTAVSLGSHGTMVVDEAQIFVKHMFAGTWKT